MKESLQMLMKTKGKELAFDESVDIEEKSRI